jgi:hypothetical protein
MKFLSLICAVCLSVAILGCESDQDASQATTSPGAVSECSTECSATCCEKGNVSPGAVGASECSSKKSSCSEAKSSCTDKANPSLGAVGGSECSSKKSSCSSKADPSLGALGSTCPASKSTCGDK